MIKNLPFEFDTPNNFMGVFDGKKNIYYEEQIGSLVIFCV